MLRKLRNLLSSEIDPAFSKRADFIFTSIYRDKPKKVLDIGCGRGFYLWGMSQFNFLEEIHGIDKNNKYLEIAQKSNLDRRVRIKKGNIYKLPYKENYFDYVICSEVLEHLEEDKKALREVKRVLKRKGTLILTVPNYDFPFFWDPLNWILMRIFNTHINKDVWWIAGIWADHIRLYQKKNLEDLVYSQRLKVIEFKSFIHYCIPFTHFILYGIGKNLIEKLGLDTFSRFNYQKGIFVKITAKIFRMPSQFDNEELLKSSSMNILVKVAKL